MLQQEGRLAGAIEEFNEAIRLDSKSATVYNRRGVAYLNLDPSQKAIADFVEAIRLEPVSVCGVELRRLQGIYPDYADKVDVYAVNYDTFQDLAKLDAHAQKQGWAWPVAAASLMIVGLWIVRRGRQQ